MMTPQFAFPFLKTSATRLTILAAALVASSAGATVFLNDNFDSYANQAAFQAVWTPNTTTATLSLDHP